MIILKIRFKTIARQALLLSGNAPGTVTSFSHISLENNGFLKIVSASPLEILQYYQDRIIVDIDVRDTNPQPGISGHCFRTGEVINVPDVKNSQFYIQITKDIQSQLSVPLIYDGTPIGVISIESNRIAAFSETEQETVSLLAKMAVIAIKNAQLYVANKHQQEVSNDLADKLMSIETERVRLTKLIEKYFDATELEDIAFKLGINVDDIPRGSHKKRVRELLQMAIRHGLGSELLEILKNERDFVEW